MTIAWIVMGLALAFYYAGWLRFFLRGRDYALLFRPIFGLSVPMAVARFSTFCFRRSFSVPSARAVAGGNPWGRAHHGRGE